MKRTSATTEKTLWDEFCDYLASIYWPEAEENLPDELVDWEYRNFRAVLSH